MSAVSEGPIPFEHVSQEENSSDPVDAVIFFGISLVLGIASRHLLRGTRVPYTVALLVLGVALGSIEYGTNHGLGRVGDGIRIWANINPDLLLAVFLPALLFESSFAMEVHQIKRCMVQMLLLAGPGVLISTFCLGTALKFAFPYNWDWKTSLLLGGLLSATDPVAVVALLKELGASKKLSTIIEGESLMNDGTAIVVFQLFYKMVLGRSFTAGAILKFLTQVSLGAVAVGLAFGLTSVLWLGFIFNDTVIEIALTLAVSYLAYFTAQDGADVSGVLTVMTLGMFYAAVARTAFKGDSQQSLHHFWEMVSYIANTVIFILSGVVIAEGVLHSGNHFQNSGTSWVNLILLYVLVQASRIIVVGTLYPSLRYFGYGLDWKEAIILIWSGLRGAVALSLSLSVKDLRMGQRIGRDTMIVTTMVIYTLGLKRMESKVLQTGVVDENKVVLYCCCIIVLAMHQYNVFGIFLFCIFKIKMRASDKSSSSNLNQEMGTLFVFFTGGIVFLTLIINGSTTQFILHFLSMDKLSDAKMRILDYTRYEMLNKAMEAFGDLGDDEELGPADWPTVKRYITCLNGLEGRQVHPHNVVESENHLHAMNLKDMRVRLLNGVQAAYWGMLDEGRINQSTAILLMQSVDEAIDLVVDEPLCDWKGLKSHVHFPSYYKFLQMSFCPPKLVTYFTVERLESSCYICAAFLRAHRIATRQLHEFIGESEIASIVINESGMEGEEARKFLEDVRVTFPQVLRVVKTRQATYSILKHLSDYVQNLEKAGLLEEKEMFQLHEGVQMDLKKLLRNPPLVKMPKLRDMLSIHPFLGALPSIFREPIEASIKQIMKLRGVALYKEGSKPNGIWLISNGVVKWSSKSLRNRHSLHPTFSHGSTLGLYEVLIGKPFICDVITDSAVHCFFIDAEKILSILRSDSAVEEFLWQESVVTIAKLLLPQTFEEMAMQELRTLIAERSTMKIFISGEIIEIHQHVIGFILEGFVRTQGSQEVLITSPAALVPSHEDLGVQNSVTSGIKTHSFCHQGTYYQVETRTRVIFFDMGLFDAPGALQRKSSSLVSHSVDLPKFLNRDHGGLMSWPEHFYKRQHHPDGIDSQVDSLFARATQLSIFGRMVSDTRRRNRSWTCHTKPSHSLSYPRISSWKAHSRPLVSVRSERTTINNSTKMRGFIEKKPISTLPSSRKEDHVHDDSSEEDECIVRIDSPSRLSFRR